MEGDLTPSSYWFGQDLNWESEKEEVTLFIELPFWLMVPNCTQNVKVNGKIFKVNIRDDYIELYANRFYNSKNNCVYVGPPVINNFSDEIQRAIEKKTIPLLSKRCKIFIIIRSNCNRDVLNMYSTGNHPSSQEYLRAFCVAHIEIINKVIQAYRSKTYDYFAYEVCPWDIPAWFIQSSTGFDVIRLFNYIEWDNKPIMRQVNNQEQTYNLATEEEIAASMNTEIGSGVIELLDAMNFMERGNYSDAVRRITTAVEAKLESVLESELLKLYSVEEAKIKLDKTKNDFPGRLRQYQKLSERVISEDLSNELDLTRELRHKIVHKAYRISFRDRGVAQKAVDTGRWIFNWLENQPSTASIRECDVSTRSLGRYFAIFDAEINDLGVTVLKPTL